MQKNKLPSMDNTLFKYTRHFLSGTMLSRLSGFFRDVSMAFAFGDIPEIAALILAYRLCMLLRRVLGEGSMQSAFVPGYQTIKEKDPALALDFFKQVVIRWILGISALCVVLGAVFTYAKPFFSSGWIQTVDLSIRLLPSLIFIIGYTIFQAFLQCHGRYFIASVAPTISNLLWGFGCIFSRHLEPYQAMQKLSLFICLGLFLQWIILIPETKKILPKDFFKFKTQKLNKEVFGFNFFGAVALAAIGVSATQINSALDGIFAKFADPKGPIHLWFSIRIQQLPLALLSIGLISAASPKLCQLVATNQHDEAKALCSSVAKKLSILMLFLTVAIMSVASEIIRLLFEHGMFSHGASHQTEACLISYMVGLVPTSLATVYASFFYALKEYKKPSRISVYCLVLNLVLNSLMVFTFAFGSWSVAAATSICSFFNAYLLRRELKKEDLFQTPPLKDTFLNVTVCLTSGLLVMSLKPFFPNLKAIFSLSLCAFFYVTTYLALCKVFKFNEALNLFSSLIPKRQKELV
jgi:putative peptidoglycan lipid II flippase